jgi:Zn-dependent protease with chaperone function
MVLLPVAYLGLTAAVAWGLWTYGRFATGTLLPEHNSTIGILLVLLPLFVGATILLCLVKPLFARFAPPSRPVRLKAGEEPLLFAFVARLCEALHAPVPREIHVDCEVNASASFRRGWLSLFQHDLVLTIGLPLIAGLPLQQLAGVMAHELGHFSQTAGLRVSLVIRTINFWLTRLVYQRDRIDVALERAAKQLRSVQLRMAVRIALLSVAFTRKVLWALMMLGHTLCAYLLRQMEFEADRYEVRLAGFSSFDLCMRELFALNIAHSMALESLQEQWKERRLVDNLPRMIVANRRQAGRSIGLEVERRIAQQVEGRFSTHPTSRQRIARALREKGVGVFASDLPAAVLFADVEALERRVSLALYQQQLGNQIKSQYLVPHEEIRERQERTEAEGASLDRYFQCPSPLKGLPLPSCLPPSADPAVAARQLAAARRGHSRSDDDHARAATRYGEAVEARFVALQAQALLEAGFLLRPGQFGLVDGTLQEALDATEETARRMSAAAGELAGFEAKETGRLLLALSLLETPAEAERLLACAALLGERFTALFNLRETGSILDILGLQAKPDRANPRLGAAIQEHFGLLLEQLKELHRGLRAAEYPFDHAEPGITLARFVIPAMPPANDYGGLIGATEQAVQRMNEVYQRLLGRLVRLAEEVEAALAAPPPDALPVPEPARSPALPAVARPSQEIVESKAEAVASRDRFAIYFKDVPELRILDLPALPAAERSALEEARAAAAHGMSAYAQRSRQYQAAERKYLQALRAEQILSAGLPLRPADFSPLPTTFPAIVQAGDQALAEMNALEPGLQAFETILAQRLVASLALLRSDDRLAARMTDAERRRGEIPVLLAGAQALQRTFPALRELRQRYTILRGLAEQVAVAGQDPRFRACVGAQVVEVHKHLQELQRGLQGAFSPFADDPDRAGRRDLAQRILPNLPRQDDVNGNFQMAGSALRELPDLHRRILGRLAETADEVERSLGGA